MHNLLADRYMWQNELSFKARGRKILIILQILDSTRVIYA